MRSCGILMPIFSLPSELPIGSLGQPAYDFINFLKESGQSYWQILPIGHTGFGNSPYQTFSSFAGNPYFIDLPMMEKQGLLDASDIDAEKSIKTDFIDYGALYETRYKTLRKAFSAFKRSEGFDNFCKQNSQWLNNYSLFMVIKDMNFGRSISEWSEAFKKRSNTVVEEITKNHRNDINFYCFLQYQFFLQWRALRKFSKDNGIKIIGDIPIYVAADSADVFENPENFILDSTYSPSEISGCPPDGFSSDGQLWGNPVYNWDYMNGDGFSWWKRRLQFNLDMFDALRIDHFRGFESYYSIPAASQSAKFGRWKSGPAYRFFDEIKSSLGNNLPIIAEDLGFLTDEVKRLLSYTGFPGMKVLQFAFDSRKESDYLPYNYPRNCIVYTGTHDNDTILGWQKSISAPDLKKARDYMCLSDDDDILRPMLCLAMASVADVCILCMQDVLGLEINARINTPSTLDDNWQWRMRGSEDLTSVSDWLLKKTDLYGRKNRFHQ